MVELAGDTIEEEVDFSHFFSSLVFFSPGLAWVTWVGRSQDTKPHGMFPWFEPWRSWDQLLTWAWLSRFINWPMTGIDKMWAMTVMNQLLKLMNVMIFNHWNVNVISFNNWYFKGMNVMSFQYQLLFSWRSWFQVLKRVTVMQSNNWNVTFMQFQLLLPWQSCKFNNKRIRNFSGWRGVEGLVRNRSEERGRKKK